MSKALKQLFRDTKYQHENKQLFDILGYYTAKRDFETVTNILRHPGNFTSDVNLANRFSKLFMLRPEAKEFFGLGANIVGSMSNMVFGGNVKIKVAHKSGQKKIEELYYDGYFMDTINELYKSSISTDGKAYLFMNTIQTYNVGTNVKIKEEFLNYKVFPSFEIEIFDNVLERTFYDSYFDSDDKEVICKFVYRYETDKNFNTTLFIMGYDEDDQLISDYLTMRILNIDETFYQYDYVPYLELNVREGMLPNIVFIEDSLAENVYFQDIDLSSAQTHTYIPEDFTYELKTNDTTVIAHNPYELRHKIKTGNLDQPTITVVKGESAINNIERNLTLNIIQGSLDAKISPISLGYSLIDKVASNTDIGVQKERVSIRLREIHIDRLKVLMALAVRDRLMLEGINIKPENIAVIFDQYITPSIETQTNVLAKQVQFGLKSNEQAVRDLNRDELSEEEVEREIELIKEFTTQRDFNVEQNLEKPKGVDNNLKGLGVKE